MKWHPSLGYFDEGFDLAAPEAFEAARRDFGRAQVLPPVAYRSKAFADLEDEKIWTRAWVCVGMHERIPHEGDLLPYTVGNHGIHIQRDDKGQLQGRFNKAQHGGCRTIPLQCQTGKRTKCSFTSCGYSRDRDVIYADELADGAAVAGQYLGFNPAKLVPIKVETWGPFVFVNLDTEARPLPEQLAGLTDKVGLRLGAHRHVGRHDVEPAANWKVVGSNFLKGSYLPPVGTLSDPDGGLAPSGAGAKGYWLYQTDVPAELMNLIEDISTPSGETAAERKATFCWVYPNLLLALLPYHIVSWIVQPTDQLACLLHMDVFVREFANELAPEVEQRVVRYWLARTRHGAALAEAMQANLLNGAAPGAELRANAMSAALPVENNFLAYCAQQYLIDRLLAYHTYYWNDAYTNPRFAVSPSTRGAS
jgi:phenylpropionate dioxygenase-like ring-hydroxylating dioxygenase large terminal subunit